MKKRKPLIIGLTGSIAVGKTVTSRALAKKGTGVLFNADEIVHKALGVGGRAEKRVAKLFPESLHHGKISRKKLGAIVFQDSVKRKKLEALLHPIVWQARRDALKKAKETGAEAVILEIPLLFETGEDENCDVTICVSAAKKIQKQRAFRRPHMTEKKWRAILAAQMTDKEKKKRADFVVRTDKGFAEARRQTAEIWDKIMKESHHA